LNGTSWKFEGKQQKKLDTLTLGLLSIRRQYWPRSMLGIIDASLSRRFYKRRAGVVFAIYIAVVHAWSFFSDQWRL
jgi:hypothetical protein